jgi:hypothetical protein
MNRTSAPTKTYPPGAFPEAPETPQTPKFRYIYSSRYFIDDDGFKIKARAVSKDNGKSWERYEPELEKPEQEKTEAVDLTPKLSWADEVDGELETREREAAEEEEKKKKKKKKKKTTTNEDLVEHQ